MIHLIGFLESFSSGRKTLKGTSGLGAYLVTRRLSWSLCTTGFKPLQQPVGEPEEPVRQRRRAQAFEPEPLVH